MKRKRIFTTTLGIIIIVLVFLSYRNLKVKEIKCKSQYGPCDSEIQEMLSAEQGNGIIYTYNTLNNKLNENLKVANHKLKFSSPLHIEVEINQRKPRIAVQATGDSNYYLYSEDGYLLSVAEQTQLPVVTLLDTSVATDKQTKFVIEMAYALNQTYNVNTVVIKQGGMEFEVPGSPKIIYPVQGDIDVLLGSLTFVLSQLNTQLGDFRMESVDFRFRNPVIRTL